MPQPNGAARAGQALPEKLFSAETLFQITNNALYGMPVNVVAAGQPTVPIVIPDWGYGSESDNPGAPISIPIPANAVIEGDGPTGPGSPVGRGDSHLIVYDRSATGRALARTVLALHGP